MKNLKLIIKYLIYHQKKKYKLDNIVPVSIKESDNHIEEKYDLKRIEYDQCFSDEEYVMPLLEAISNTPHFEKQYNKDHVIKSDLYTKHSNSDITLDGDPFDKG